jgi:hypothetical protein
MLYKNWEQVDKINRKIRVQNNGDAKMSMRFEDFIEKNRLRVRVQLF